MEDVFYFTKTGIALQDIAHCAEKNGYMYGYTDYVDAGQSLVIDYSKEDYCRWHEIEDTEFYEERHRRKVESLGSHSSFHILYRTVSASNLRELLRCILQCYGGWIGCADDWEKTYTLENIEALNCSYANSDY